MMDGRWLRVTLIEHHEQFGVKERAPFCIMVGDSIHVGDEVTDDGGPTKIILSFDDEENISLRVWVEKGQRTGLIRG